jgi:hypothetical protein
MGGVKDLLGDKEFGTDPHKLARTTDPDTSHAAAHTVDTSGMEKMVYDFIKSRPKGVIQDDIYDGFPQYRDHSLTPRVAPLLRKGLIYDTGERRYGKAGRRQRVVKAYD